MAIQLPNYVNKKNIIYLSVILFVLVVSIVAGNIVIKHNRELNALLTTPEVGQFQVIITSTGELEAEKSVEIYGPTTDNNRIRIQDLDIIDIVDEGTEVKRGDYVATIDRSTVESSYEDAKETLKTRQESYEMALLDSATTLGNARSNLQKGQYAIESARIRLTQVEYDSPAKVRSAERALQKSEREYEEQLLQYNLTVLKQEQSIRNAQDRYEDQAQMVADYAKMLEEFIIYAPSDGMVVYYQDFFGDKRKVGSSIDRMDNVVAVLPDMSSLISKTYVNEIDVNKVKVGQSVNITLDALPRNNYTGKVISVANVGEQLANASAKVFEVVIRLDNIDNQLRPSMTTGNKIFTSSEEEALYIPLASVQRDTANIPYVYLRNGKKQIVVLGASSDDKVIVEDGLDIRTKIYLNPPTKKHRNNDIVLGEELIAKIKLKEEV